MSIIERPSRLFNRVAPDHQDRRSFLGRLGACLAIPFVGRSAVAAATPPGNVRVLDPADPVAIELDRLYEVLRGTWAGDIRTMFAAIAHDERCTSETGCEECNYGNSAQWDAACISQQTSWKASAKLRDAVLEAAGAVEPSLEAWHSLGRPIASVRVGRRIFAVSADSDMDYNEDDKMVCCEVTIIDL